MKIRNWLAPAVAIIALAAAATASATSISLGASNEDYVLYGQGAYAPGLGSFTNQQGSESFDAGTDTTTDTLTGLIAGSTSSALNSGSYAFVTTYTGSPIGAGGAELQSISNAMNSNFFNYSFLDPSLDMTLTLTGTPSGAVVIPIVTDGNFDGPGFSFLFTGTETCTVVTVCGQNNVGLTLGSSLSASTTIFVSLPTPEPETWALLLVGFGAAGGALRMRRRGALAKV